MSWWRYYFILIVVTVFFSLSFMIDNSFFLFLVVCLTDSKCIINQDDRKEHHDNVSLLHLSTEMKRKENLVTEKKNLFISVYMDNSCYSSNDRLLIICFSHIFFIYFIRSSDFLFFLKLYTISQETLFFGLNHK